MCGSATTLTVNIRISAYIPKCGVLGFFFEKVKFFLVSENSVFTQMQGFLPNWV
jgi:hypothetical protein